MVAFLQLVRFRLSGQGICGVNYSPV